MLLSLRSASWHQQRGEAAFFGMEKGELRSNALLMGDSATL